MQRRALLGLAVLAIAALAWLLVRSDAPEAAPERAGGSAEGTSKSAESRAAPSLAAGESREAFSFSGSADVRDSARALLPDAGDAGPETAPGEAP